MTKEEFLAEVGLSNDEFRDLVQKFIQFLEPLSEAQRDAIHRSLPTISEAARSLGPDVTRERLGEILNEILRGIDYVMLNCHAISVMNLDPRRSIAPPQHKPEKPE